MEKRKITARDVLKDIRAGMSDSALMQKYKLSAQGLQGVFNKLINAGAITPTELEDRVPLTERTVDLGLFICSACGHIQGKEFTKCPRCGFVPPSYLKKGREKETADRPAPARKKVSTGTTVLTPPRAETDSEAASETASPEKPALPPTELSNVGRFCRLLGMAAIGAYIVSAIALFIVVKVSWQPDSVTAAQMLFAVLALALTSALMAFLVLATARSMGTMAKAMSSLIETVRSHRTLDEEIK